MAAPKLRTPDHIRAMLATRYRRMQAEWFAGGGAWPLALPLGVPSEADAMKAFDAVRTWTSAWRDWHGPGAITWAERRWPRIGTQQIPERITLQGPEEVAALIGAGEGWSRAAVRRDEYAARWPRLAPLLPRHFTWLSTAPEADVMRMAILMDWLAANPDTGLYPRQLPVPGLDSKWLEGQAGRVREFHGAISGGGGDSGDIHAVCGLRRLPVRIRMRVLDADLRARLGGLGDIEVPVGEIAALRLPVTRAFVVENFQTGLAFDDLPGAVLFMGLGYSVDLLGQVPWLAGLLAWYWGDLDTHGFAILDRARAHVPGIASLLMDEKTLLAHEPLWGSEATPCSAELLPRLTPEERAVYEGLRDARWGTNLRLEQERIDWGYAWARIRDV